MEIVLNVRFENGLHIQGISPQWGNTTVTLLYRSDPPE